MIVYQKYHVFFIRKYRIEYLFVTIIFIILFSY